VRKGITPEFGKY
jgi:hypothetical protein